MLTCARLRDDRREFLALTGLTLAEFDLLLGGFTRAYRRRCRADRTAAGGPRLRQPGGGRRPILGGPEQKLLFILVYLKAYPLQVLMGELFGLSQPAVNHWVHRLLPVLLAALDDLGVRPERDPGRFADTPAPPGAAGGARPLIIDGTERPRQRPKSPAKQALHYSGKRRTHTDKNVLVVEARGGGRVGFLSRTYPGKAHDKAVADREDVAYPPGAVLHKDAGFQGYEPATVATTWQAKKKPRGGQLTGAEKRTNRRLARFRVRVEHAIAGVKRSMRREGRVAEHQGRRLR